MPFEKITDLFKELSYLRDGLDKITKNKTFDQPFFEHLKELDVLDSFCDEDPEGSFVAGVLDINHSEFLFGFLCYELDKILGEDNYEIETELTDGPGSEPADCITIKYTDENGESASFSQVFSYTLL